MNRPPRVPRPPCAVAAPSRRGRRVAAAEPTDIRIDEVRHGYEDYVYRAPYKFGGRVVDRVTLLNVRCRVTTRNGKTRVGLRLDDDGQHVGVPVEDDVVRHDARRDEGAGRAASRGITGDCTEIGHPLDIATSSSPST